VLKDVKIIIIIIIIARIVEVSGLPISCGIQAAGKVLEFGAQKNISIQGPLPKS
jgi:hypothetical protein